MPTNKWIIHVATGELKYGGFYEPIPPQIGIDENGQPMYDPAYAVVTIPTEKMPDPATYRWNGFSAVPKSPAEIFAQILATKAAHMVEKSRQKDILVTCAEIVRARGAVAWSNMTLQQKIDATLAEADVWVNIRQFVEDAFK